MKRTKAPHKRVWPCRAYLSWLPLPTVWLWANSVGTLDTRATAQAAGLGGTLRDLNTNTELYFLLQWETHGAGITANKLVRTTAASIKLHWVRCDNDYGGDNYDDDGSRDSFLNNRQFQAQMADFITLSCCEGLKPNMVGISSMLCDSI